MTMNSKDEGYTGGTWLTGWGHERRKAKGIERARRKRAAEREVLQDLSPSRDPFTRCTGCGERFCDGC